MKFLYLLVTCALLAATFTNCSDNKNRKTNKDGEEATVDFNLKIMTYNIRHANPPSKGDLIDIGSIVKTIKAEAPDVVALQEVDADTERSGAGNQAEMIAKELDMHYFYAKSIDFQGGEYGVAILSKFPMENEKINRLPTIPETKGEPRVLATAGIRISDGKQLIFGSTHLDAQKSSENRILQIEEINKIAETQGNELMIIAGDFNALPGSQVINTLDSAFRRTCDSCSPSFPETEPKKVIDFIAYRPGTYTVKVKKYKVIDDSYSSDHRPVTAEFEFQKP